eukprot:1131-Ditylum_brightwellii.AAC.1
MTAHDGVSTAKSQTRYIITYANCPILWASKLQTFITLSTTEAEYVALSTVLCETIVIMNFLKEIEERGIVEELWNWPEYQQCAHVADT